MTKEEYQSKLAELEASVRDNVAKYNVAYGAKKLDEAAELSAKIDKDVEEHGSIAQKLCFEHLIEQPDPMLAACLTLTYDTIAVKDVLEGEGEIKTLKRDVVDKAKQIDLLKLEKFSKDRIGKTIGHDAKWNNMVERLNLMFALDCAVTIGKGADFLKTMGDTYVIQEASKEINFGVKNPKAGTPISNTALIKAVSAVVTAMIGEDYGKRTLTHDVKFLKIACARKSKKALTIQCANHKLMRAYLMEVCNRIATGGVYDVDYKKRKQ